MTMREVGVFGLIALLGACGLAAPQAAAQGYRIAGKVVSSTTGERLGRVRVTIADVRDRSRTGSVITGDDGAFVFANLPAGKYSLKAARRGFIESYFMQHGQFSTAIVTGGEVDSEHLVFRLTPQAILSGRVFDEAGEAVRKARVALFRQDQNAGFERVHTMATQRTDDRGAYEFAELAAGNYFLSVTARPWYAVNPRSMQTGGGTSRTRSPDGTWTTETHEATVETPEAIAGFDVAYPTTYYPDVTDSDEAVPIPLRGGERLTVDMHLNPVPALRVVIRTSGSGAMGFAMPQITKRAFDSEDDILAAYMDRGPAAQDDPRPSVVNMLGPGMAEISGIPAGRYTLRMRGIPGTGQAGTRSEVELTQDGQEVTPSAGETVGSVKFAVQIAGEASVPQELMLALKTPERKVVRGAPVNAEGKCEMQEVPPGKYELLAATPNTDYAVTGMVVNGGVSRGHGLEIASGTSTEATVTLVAGEAVVQGVAKRDGKGMAGVMIVMVPKDPETHQELFRRDQSDSDGTFSLANVIPGDYTVLAIEDGWDLNWSEPGVIEHYVPKGQKVVVPAGESGTVKLERAVEVEGK